VHHGDGIASNLRLLQSKEPLSVTERRRLVKTFHRGNLLRLLALAVAKWALHQGASTADSEMSR
jgi:hypothetical protein